MKFGKQRRLGWLLGLLVVSSASVLGACGKQQPPATSGASESDHDTRPTRPVVRTDENNVVARYLLGTWELDPALTGELTGRSSHKVQKVSFSSDSLVAEKIPLKFDEYLADKRIYLAGIMTFTFQGRVEEFPYILTALGGTPKVVFFEETEGEPMGDAESFYLSFAGARDPSNALLFLGGDFVDEPFMAFRRTK